MYSNHNHRNVYQGTATASTLRGFHHLYNNFKQDTTTTGMSIKGQQLLHYEDFTTYIIYLNRDTTTTGMSTRDSNWYHHLYNIFKQDTTTTGMSIKGQQLRLHYENFTTYIIYLNRTPQPQECLMSIRRDSNCVYTTRIHHLYNIFKQEECLSRDSTASTLRGYHLYNIL